MQIFRTHVSFEKNQGIAMQISSLTVLTQMFYEPYRAFEALKNNGRAWLPLLLLILLTTAVMFWYMHTVDFAWLIHRMANADPSMDSAERAEMLKVISPTFLTASTLGSAIIGIPVEYALYALYYLIVSKLMGSHIQYSKWFVFAAWISVPGLLALPLMALQISTGNGQIALEDLNIMSFNFLIFHLPPGNAWASPASSVSLTTIWTAVLAVIGLRSWTHASLAQCTFAALLPLAAVYGIWAVKIMVFN